MTQDQYREQLQALLPPGKALEDSNGTLRDLLEGLAAEFARVDGRGDTLLSEALPSSTLELMPDWERVANLPDDCTPTGQSIEARRQALIARLTASDSPTPAYLQSLAASLGYPVTIVERRAFRCGMTCGSPLGGTDWQFVWEVHAALYNVSYFRAGQGAAGEPLASWQNDVLECVMRQHAPAHTIVNFIYS